jgi:hypothetical protein
LDSSALGVPPNEAGVGVPLHVRLSGHESDIVIVVEEVVAYSTGWQFDLVVHDPPGNPAGIWWEGRDAAPVRLLYGQESVAQWTPGGWVTSSYVEVCATDAMRTGSHHRLGTWVSPIPSHADVTFELASSEGVQLDARDIALGSCLRDARDQSVALWPLRRISVEAGSLLQTDGVVGTRADIANRRAVSPSACEIGTPLPFSAFVTKSGSIAIAVRNVVAYRDGIVFTVAVRGASHVDILPSGFAEDAELVPLEVAGRVCGVRVEIGPPGGPLVHVGRSPIVTSGEMMIRRLRVRGRPGGWDETYWVSPPSPHGLTVKYDDDQQLAPDGRCIVPPGLRQGPGEE